MSNARIYLAYGYEVGVGQMYGVPAYGTIGFGIATAPGFPMVSGPELVEIVEGIDAIVTEAWGIPTYATFLVRQAKVPGPAEFFSIQRDEMTSPEFVEDEDLDVQLRILETETIAFEWDEYVWPG